MGWFVRSSVADTLTYFREDAASAVPGLLKALKEEDDDYVRERLVRGLAHFGPDDPKSLASAVGLADAYQFAGRWDKSVPLLEQTVEKQRTFCGPTHASTLGTMHNLARNYCEVDRVGN